MRDLKGKIRGDGKFRSTWRTLSSAQPSPARAFHQSSRLAESHRRGRGLLQRLAVLHWRTEVAAPRGTRGGAARRLRDRTPPPPGEAHGSPRSGVFGGTPVKPGAGGDWDQHTHLFGWTTAGAGSRRRGLRTALTLPPCHWQLAPAGALGSPSCGARRGAAAGRRAAQRGCTWRAPRTDHCHWAEADCWAGRGLRAHLRPRAPRTGRALGAETSGTPLPGARPPRGACAAGAWRAAFWES